MAGRYVTPEYGKSPFTCPHVECQTLGQQTSNALHLAKTGVHVDAALYGTRCGICGRGSVWSREQVETAASVAASNSHLRERIQALDTGNDVEEAPVAEYETGWRLVHPATTQAPAPNTDLPDAIRRDYDEAAQVLPHSARAAAALLRLAVQRICKELGEPGKDINTDIGSLVRKDRISASLQQAMDTVRITGNESVHPGTLDVSDDPDLALALFHLVNKIAEKAFTEPREMAELYAKMPESKRNGVAQRDGTPPIGTPAPEAE